MKKLILIILSMAFLGIIAVIGIFATLIGAFLIPLTRGIKKPLPNEEQPTKIENTIDAEFTRVDPKE